MSRDDKPTTFRDDSTARCPRCGEKAKRTTTFKAGDMPESRITYTCSEGHEWQPDVTVGRDVRI